jgi:AcrR family transcriptional regulator
MKPARVDPRILRTRLALRGALAALLRERGFEDLTLNEIAAASGLNRATIYKHFPDKFALLDDWVTDEFQRRLVEVTSGGAWSGSEKLAAVIAAACQSVEWVESIGRTDDRLLRPIAEARLRALLTQVVEFGLAEKLVVAVGRRDLAAAMAGAAIYGAAQAWPQQRGKKLAGYVASVIEGLRGILAPNPGPPSRSRRQLAF